MKIVVGIITGLAAVALILSQYELPAGIAEPATMTFLGATVATTASLVRRQHRLKQERSSVLHVTE